MEDMKPWRSRDRSWSTGQQKSFNSRTDQWTIIRRYYSLGHVLGLRSIKHARRSITLGVKKYFLGLRSTTRSGVLNCSSKLPEKKASGLPPDCAKRGEEKAEQVQSTSALNGGPAVKLCIGSISGLMGWLPVGFGFESEVG